MLVDRKAECAAIDDLLEGACGGASGALVLRGVAGIGKSALLDYAVATATDFAVLRVTGIESEIALGFAAVHQLVYPLLEHTEQLPEPQRHALESVFGLVDHGTPDPLLVFLGVFTLLDEAAHAQPTLLVIDDAQWLDDESARVLAFAARRLHADPIAMLFAVREEELGTEIFDALPDLEVLPLPDVDARLLLEYVVGGPLDADVAERLLEETRGNPLALLEFVAELSEDQLRGNMQLPVPLPVGRRLQDQFATRARLLEPSAGTVLLLAAAERFGDLALLHRAATAMAVLWDDGVAGVEAAGLATFGPTLTFRHPLIRSGVYHGATPSDRRRAHLALAGALDPQRDGDRRAWHLAAAATAPDEDLARALEESGGRALQRGGSAAAAEFLERASELTPDPMRSIDRLLEAVRLRAACGDAARAQRLLDVALSRVGPGRQRAEVEWTQGLIWLEDGRGREALTSLARAVASIEVYERGFPLDALITADVAALYVGALRDGPLVDEVAAVARRFLTGDDGPLTPDELLAKGVAIALTEGYVAAAPALRAALTFLRQNSEQMDPAAMPTAREHANGLDLLAVHAAAGLLDDAALHAVTLAWVDFSRHARTLTTLPIALDLLSVCHVFAGRFRSAEAAIAEAEGILSFAGSRGHIGDPGLGELLLHGYRGDDEKTRAAARRKARDARERGAGVDLDHAHYALAVLELGWRRYPAALEHCREIDANDPFSLSGLAPPILIEAAVRCDDLTTAQAALDQYSERVTASGSDWAHGLLSAMRALVADDECAEALYCEALARLSCSTAAFDRGRVQVLYGEWLRRVRRRKDAREPLREALEFFEQIGARAFAERARRELTATGEHSRPRSDATRDLLTAQESQIAQLVADGKTNGEIASQLYISRSTVEYHLRKVYAKLGVNTRTQLARIQLER